MSCNISVLDLMDLASSGVCTVTPATIHSTSMSRRCSNTQPAWRRYAIGMPNLAKPAELWNARLRGMKIRL